VLCGSFGSSEFTCLKWENRSIIAAKVASVAATVIPAILADSIFNSWVRISNSE